MNTIVNLQYLSKVPGNKETLQVYPVNYKYMKITNIYLYIYYTTLTKYIRIKKEE